MSTEERPRTGEKKGGRGGARGGAERQFAPAGVVFSSNPLLTRKRLKSRLILDHKRTRLRTAELALARQAADAETPPAFSPPPGAHTPTTPSGGYGGHAAPGGGTHQPPLGGVFGAAASPATALQIQAQQQRLAEQATQALRRRRARAGRTGRSDECRTATAGGRGRVGRQRTRGRRFTLASSRKRSPHTS